MTPGLAQPGLIPRAALLGTGLTLINTLISVSADALAKDLVTTYAAPQLMALSGLLAVAFGLVLTGAGQGDKVLRSPVPGLVLIRSCLGAISTLGFFYALQMLDFAAVFPFIALMPIFGALLSWVLLKERILQAAWIALGCGIAGMIIILPGVPHGATTGYLVGLGASMTGSASLVLSRRISARGTHSFAQVFYAQLACAALGLVLLPLIWQPMQPLHLVMLAAYTGFIIATRWLIVTILRMLPAHVVLQLANIQFIWMVILGHHLFGEVAGPELLLGAGLIILSGIWLVNQQHRAQTRPT